LKQKYSAEEVSPILEAIAQIADITAWILLAFIIAVVKATGITGALFSMSLAILFILVMVFGVKLRISHWFMTGPLLTLSDVFERRRRNDDAR
jgi:Kef-type K+ transport system membrane component KefB